MCALAAAPTARPSPSLARQLYSDFRANPDSPRFAGIDKKLATMSIEDSYTDKDVEKTFGAAAAEAYKVRDARDGLC